MAGTVSWADVDDDVWTIGPSGGEIMIDDETTELEADDEDLGCSVVCRSAVL